MPKLIAVPSLLVVTLLLCSLGCGTPCQQIASQREAFLDRPDESRQPDIDLDIPFPLVNRILAQRLGSLPEERLRISKLGPLSRFFDGVRLEVTSVELVPAQPRHVGVAITVGVSVGRRSAATLRFTADVRPVISGRRLDIVFRADSLRGVRPRLTAGGVDALTDAIVGGLPGSARVVIKRRDVARIADTVLDRVVASSYDVLRRRVLRHIELEGRVSVQLPALPIEDVVVRSIGGARGVLRLGVALSLPTGRALAPAKPATGKRAQHVGLRISGPAAAALGNWALLKGHLPDRYTRAGKPAKDGKYVPGLAWSDGARPLSVHLWKTEAPCIHARLGATPRVALKRGHVTLSVTDGRIEELHGPPEVEIAGWFAFLWADTIEFSASRSAALELKVAGERLRFQAVRAHADRDAFSLLLAPR